MTISYRRLSVDQDAQGNHRHGLRVLLVGGQQIWRKSAWASWLRFDDVEWPIAGRSNTLRKSERAFEAAGIEFIDENGGGPGVRLRKRQRLKKPK